jgi:hypothetical protein
LESAVKINSRIITTNEKIRNENDISFGINGFFIMLGNALESDKLRKNSQLKRSREEKDKIHQSAAAAGPWSVPGVGGILGKKTIKA